MRGKGKNKKALKKFTNQLKGSIKTLEERAVDELLDEEIDLPPSQLALSMLYINPIPTKSGQNSKIQTERQLTKRKKKIRRKGSDLNPENWKTDNTQKKYQRFNSQPTNHSISNNNQNSYIKRLMSAKSKSKKNQNPKEKISKKEKNLKKIFSKEKIDNSYLNQIYKRKYSIGQDYRIRGKTKAKSTRLYKSMNKKQPKMKKLKKSDKEIMTHFLKSSDSKLRSMASADYKEVLKHRIQYQSNNDNEVVPYEKMFYFENGRKISQEHRVSTARSYLNSKKSDWKKNTVISAC